MSTAVHSLPICTLTSFSVEEILLPKDENWSTYFRCFSHGDQSLQIILQMSGLGWIGFYVISTTAGYKNAKSNLYISIKYIGFGLVDFYAVSSIVGYLMPNPLIYIYIYIYVCSV